MTPKTESPRPVWLVVAVALVAIVAMALGAGALSQHLFGFPWGERVAKTVTIGGSISMVLLLILRPTLSSSRR